MGKRPDLNATLMAHGEDAVRARLDAAERYMPARKCLDTGGQWVDGDTGWTDRGGRQHPFPAAEGTIVASFPVIERIEAVEEVELPSPVPPEIIHEVAVAVLDKSAITQDAVADSFAERAEGKLRFDVDRGIWFSWGQTHWEVGNKHVGFQFARRLSREASAGQKTSVLKETGKAAFAAGVERFAQGDPRLSIGSVSWDADPFLLGTPGGTVDLKTGLLRPSKPAENITKQTAVAPADAEHCPQFKAFLDFATGAEMESGDPLMPGYLQRIFGYCLTGSVREQALWFFYGGGGNGKGTLINLVQKILGDYAITAVMDTFTASMSDKHTTDLAMLRGARMVTASETESGRAWAEARIKQLTGSDPITARFMRQDNFTFIPQFKLVFLGNNKPILHKVDDAVARRFNMIPFLRKPEAVDTELDQKLFAEAPGILRWMINGCLIWQKTGLQRPESVAEATKMYLSEQDIFGQWLEDECRAEPGNRHLFETSARLFEAWNAYLARAGSRQEQRATFCETLVKRGFSPKRLNRARGYCGIELKRPSSDDGGER